MPRWLQSVFFRSQLLQRILYRYRCPYPVIDDKSARACVESGNCGCDNQRRYSAPTRR